MDPEVLRFLGTIFGAPQQPKIGPYKENAPKPQPIPEMTWQQKHPDATRLEAFIRNRAQDLASPMSPQQMQKAMVDAGMNSGGPMLAVGSIRKVGDATLPPVMSHLAKYFKAIQKGPFDEYMAEKVALRDLLRSKPEHSLKGIKQELPIHHSSRALFEHPDPAVFGTGAGDQWQGWGTYLAGHPEVAKFYRRLTQEELRSIHSLWRNKPVSDELWKLLASPSLQKHPALAELASRIERDLNSFLPETERLPTNRRHVEYAADKIRMSLKDARKNARLYYRRDRDTYENLKRASEARIGQADLGGIAENTYHGNLYANPDELWNMQQKVGDQPASEKLLAGLNQLTTNGSYGFGKANTMPLGDALASQMESLGHPAQSYSFTANALRDGVYDNTPKQIAEALRSKGVVGNRYLNRGMVNKLDPEILGNLPQSILDDSNNWNYVVTDPSRIDFRDLTALLAAAGLGGAGMQANKQQKKKK